MLPPQQSSCATAHRGSEDPVGSESILSSSIGCSRRSGSVAYPCLRCHRTERPSSWLEAESVPWSTRRIRRNRTRYAPGSPRHSPRPTAVSHVPGFSPTALELCYADAVRAAAAAACFATLSFSDPWTIASISKPAVCVLPPRRAASRSARASVGCSRDQPGGHSTCV